MNSLMFMFMPSLPFKMDLERGGSPVSKTKFMIIDHDVHGADCQTIAPTMLYFDISHVCFFALFCLYFVPQMIL